MPHRVLFFSDPIGSAVTKAAAPWFQPVGVVMAGIRPAHFADMAVLANSYEVPLLVQPGFKSEDYEDFVESVNRLKPDTIFVNSYSMILRDDVLAIPPLGAINIHGAPLPEFRGANPVEWGLIRETAFAGVTAHYIDSGIDTGDLIAVRRFNVDFEDTWQDVRRKVLAETEILLEEVLPPLSAGMPLPRAKQDESYARYNKRRSASDGRIGWEQPLREIYNMVRALVAPHPGAIVESARSKSHLTRLHTIPELTAAKFAALGQDTWTSNRFRLIPQPHPRHADEPSRDIRIFENRHLKLDIIEKTSGIRGECELLFDWRNPSIKVTAVIRMDRSDDRELSELVAHFCRAEFNLEADVSVL